MPFNINITQCMYLINETTQNELKNCIARQPYNLYHDAIALGIILALWFLFGFKRTGKRKNSPMLIEKGNWWLIFLFIALSAIYLALFEYGGWVELLQWFGKIT